MRSHIFGNMCGQARPITRPYVPIWVVLLVIEPVRETARQLRLLPLESGRYFQGGFRLGLTSIIWLEHLVDMDFCLSSARLWARYLAYELTVDVREISVSESP